MNKQDYINYLLAVYTEVYAGKTASPLLIQAGDTYLKHALQYPVNPDVWDDDFAAVMASSITVEASLADVRIVDGVVYPHYESLESNNFKAGLVQLDTTLANMTEDQVAIMQVTVSTVLTKTKEHAL